MSIILRFRLLYSFINQQPIMLHFPIFRHSLVNLANTVVFTPINVFRNNIHRIFSTRDWVCTRHPILLVLLHTLSNALFPALNPNLSVCSSRAPSRHPPVYCTYLPAYQYRSSGPVLASSFLLPFYFFRPLRNLQYCTTRHCLF